MRGEADLVEKVVDDRPHIASLGIEKKRNAGQFRWPNGRNVPATHAGRRRAHKKQLFFEQRDDPDILFGEWKRNQPKIEPPVYHAMDNFFGDPHRNPDLSLGILLTQQAKRAAQAVNQRCDPSSKNERTAIRRWIVLEVMLQLDHLFDHGAGVLREAKCRRRGQQALSRPYEQLGAKFGGEIVELKTDSAG